MDQVALTIERDDANPFIMIISRFDTLPEIKKKIQKIKGIPISQQTLIFQGQILTDDFDILRCNKSRIQLVVNKQFPSPPLKKPENDFPTPPARDCPLKKNADIDREVKLVQEMLKRHRLMTAEKFPKPPPAAVSENELETAKKAEVKIGVDVSERRRRADTEKEGPLRVVVVFEGERTEVLVHKEHSVWSLREKLDMMEMAGLFDYPGYPFFFFHRLDVMKDDKSFEWHQVQQGDHIHIISVY